MILAGVAGAIACRFGVLFVSRREKAFRAAAKKLGAVLYAPRSDGFGLTKSDLTIGLRYRRPHGEDHGHTSVEAMVPSLPVLLHLRRRNSHRDAEDDHGLLDIETGDPEIDDAWIIDGAPLERTVRLLCDPRVRWRLVAFARHRGADVDLSGRTIKIERDGCDYVAGGVRLEAIELALALAAAAVSEAKKPSPNSTVAEGASAEGDYRCAPALAPTAADADDDEIEGLRALRKDSRLEATARPTTRPKGSKQRTPAR